MWGKDIFLFPATEYPLLGGNGGGLSSTETMVEGSQSWNFQNPLPSTRYGLRGISLSDTVIMTGKECPHFYLTDPFHGGYFRY